MAIYLRVHSNRAFTETVKFEAKLAGLSMSQYMKRAIVNQCQHDYKARVEKEKYRETWE